MRGKLILIILIKGTERILRHPQRDHLDAKRWGTEVVFFWIPTFDTGEDPMHCGSSGKGTGR